MANTSPLPNPWTGTGRSVGGGTEQTINFAEEEDRSISIDEEEEEEEYNATSSLSVQGQQCLAVYCGYNSGEPLRDWFLQKATSFCFAVSCLDIAMLVISLCIPPYGFAPWSQNKMLGPRTEALLTLGALYAPLVRRKYQIWRMFTAVILHSGIIHLLMNLMVQLSFGVVFEKQWGTPKIALVYVVAGLGGSLLSLCAAPNTIAVGASGALVGLIGALLASILVTWEETQQQQREQQLKQTVIWIVWITVLSVLPGISWSGHLGGFIVGFFLMAALMHKEHKKYSVWILGVSCSMLLVYLILCVSLFWSGVVQIPID